MDVEIGIGFGETTPKTIDKLLSSIFWKKKSLAPKAKDFLTHIKEWSRTDSPYTVDEWENYCIRSNISQSSYHNMLKRLRKAGLVEKKYNEHRKTHELHISDSFSGTLREMARVWDNYIID